MEIHHIAVSVKNLNKSVNFYKNIFGFSVAKKFERKDLKGKAAFIKLKNIILELWQFERKIINKNSLNNLSVIGLKHIAFGVADIAKEYKRIKLKGVKISKPEPGASGAKYCFLRDPNGIPIELYEKI